MRYFALASDYDGTLAHDGKVNEATVRALERLVRSGRKLILVTGRELPDLKAVFPRLDLCERVVAENGALLYNPATQEQRALAQRPPGDFIQALRARGVSDFSVGEVILATWRPHEVQVLEAIQELGLELQIIFNKDAVMVLPSGVNKKSGLCVALEELGLSPHNVAAIGDAENDHAFLESCECPIAVANAIPALKAQAAVVTAGARGEGVCEVIARLLENDLADVEGMRARNRIAVGSADAEEVSLPAYGSAVLVCGQSGSGKSSLVIALLERIIERKYQICLVDPEGDYENLPGFRTLGTEKHAPSIGEIEQALEESRVDVIMNLVGVAAADRAHRFSSLIASVQAIRLRTGRPHWIIIDEAHHVLPSEWALAPAELTSKFTNVLLITVHPDHVSQQVLANVDTVVAVGREPRTSLEGFARAIGRAAPVASAADLERGQALVWFVGEDRVYAPVQVKPSRTQHERHKRKYAEGRLEEERIFHFCGPEGKMDLRAHNLSIFIQLAEGVDDETWQFHLRRADYSGWIRRALKDSQLADEIAKVEKDESLQNRETRECIIAAIQRKYTAPV
jgi:hydroxymethylpyrimidine pyrophosphatase-like HAD family hydrolase/energy-coupling factor transporter ATP-binding protein EcfA2